MASEGDGEGFHFNTYREYVAALSKTDNAYQKLSRFFTNSPDAAYDANVQQDIQVPRKGSVMIVDYLDGGKLNSRQYSFGCYGTKRNYTECVDYLEIGEGEPHAQGHRVVFLSYHRNPLTGEYSGINIDILDIISRKYKIHPEVLLWHFGSDYGLDKRFFPFAAPPIPSALSSSRYCHIVNDHSLFSCCLSTRSINKSEPQTRE